MPVSPRSVKLTDGRSQQFTLVDANGTAVAVPPGGWTISAPVAGTIDDTGMYTAPGEVTAAREVTVNATPAGGNAETATVQLVVPEVILTPNKVKLRAGERQQFTAIVPGDPGNDVNWTFAPTLTVQPGNSYTAPDPIKQDQEVLVIATSAVNPRKSDQATVTLLSKPPWVGWIVGLMLYLTAVFCLVFLLIDLWPPGLYDRADLEKKQIARIAAEADEKKAGAAQSDSQAALNKSPANENLKKKLANATAAAAKAAEVRNQAVKEEQSETENLRKSEEREVWVPGGNGSREVDLLWLVIVAGALGAFVYSARSFVDFVGNRMIRVSWSAWYLLYPLIGAALALIFYLVIRGGFLTSASKGSDINVYGLVAISGMVGMFSKQATNKLDELFSTMFKSDKDDKALKDKLG